MRVATFAFLALNFAFAVGVQAAVTTNATDLLGGVTTYALRDYENLYDANGNLVTNSPAKVGDTVQGVFVVTQVSNQFGTATYSPTTPGGVEVTGVFDAVISGFDSAGNAIYTPDTSGATSGGNSGKAMSGAAFQAAFGTGAMLAMFQNNSNAMPKQLVGNGLVGLSTAQAMALATAGSKWATFGQNGAWGDPNGYFWAGSPQSQFGVGTSVASLGLIQNLTGLDTSQLVPTTPTLPAGFSTDPSISASPNVLIMQETTTTSNLNLDGTPYYIFSSHPMVLDPVPEPSGILVMGGLFGLWAVGSAIYRSVRMARR